MTNYVAENSSREEAALCAAGHAVAAILQGQGIEDDVRIYKDDGSWEAECNRADYVSHEACVTFLLAGPMAAYTGNPEEYEPFSAWHVRPMDHWEAQEAINEWTDCPLRYRTNGEVADEVEGMELDCLFELYKIRALAFLTQPDRLRALKALAQALETHKRLTPAKAKKIVNRAMVPTVE